MSQDRGLDHCPICGESFPRRDVVIHSHPGITTSNLREDWRDRDGRLVFSYAGMMAQLRQMGYLAYGPGVWVMANVPVPDARTAREGTT